MEAYETGGLLGGRYRLTGRQATGATAVVWRAHDELLNRPVAVKALHSHLADDTDLSARFADEARVAATVNHRSLVGVYDTISRPTPAIVLEYVDGPDLRQRLDAGPCSVAEVLGLGWAMADALDVAHRAGLVHRDVKPANIICTRDGHPKLGDFGIATASAGDRTATGLVLGTAKYLAPEQVQGGHIDARTDVYALSVVLYEALCGRVPFERAGDLPTAIARLEEAPPMPRTIRPDIPTGVESLVLRGLARQPEGRWPSAAALRDAIGLEAERLAVEIGPIVLPPAPPLDASPAIGANRHGSSHDHAPTVALDAPDEGGAPRRGRGGWTRRVLVALAFAAVSILGWMLIVDANPLTEVSDLLPSNEPDPVAVLATAFDPEGRGTPGEHDELAVNVLDGDPDTQWHTESYDERQMGAKRGVGLVIDLAEPAVIEEVTISADGTDWAAAVYVTDSTPDSLDEWGPALVVANGLASDVTLRPGTRGRSLLVWITDLGSAGPPFRLAVHEVTIS